MEQTYEFLTEAGTYFLATVDENNAPRVRPFGTVNLFDDRIYIQTGLKKGVAKQLLANPKAELCAFADGRWLRVSGNLIHDERIEAQEALLSEYPSLSERYKAGDGNNAVFYFEDPKSVLYSFTDEPKTLL